MQPGRFARRSIGVAIACAVVALALILAIRLGTQPGAVRAPGPAPTYAAIGEGPAATPPPVELRSAIDEGSPVRSAEAPTVDWDLVTSESDYCQCGR